MVSISLALSEVAVFYTALVPTAFDDMRKMESMLDSDEQIRAKRFLFEKDRHCFIVSRALLRHSLSSVAGTRSWRFKIDDYGKPELAHPHGDPPLRFNLSHTEGLAVCAVACGHSVGIDVETLTRSLDYSEIAEQCFTVDELRQLAACNEVEKTEVFFQIWTLKEAVVKAIGQGLSFPLQDISFTLAPLSLTFAPGCGEDPQWWQIEQRAPTAIHRIALAIRRFSGTALDVHWQPVNTDMFYRNIPQLIG